ncbi:MAG: substrate-binding domain-containing protein [Bacteroidales bacterium]|jgi:molybdate/tungstate transport system substrate-binding protein|nr:substrate-binding domain-containing protein [Bacteroidales bacterium]
MSRQILVISFFLSVFLISCQGRADKNKEAGSNDSISGELIIFHAGSMTVPVKVIADSFQKLHPTLRIYSEAAGSRECARKISDLKKPCDIMISADYLVIDNMLIPDYTDWSIKFASNEMVIAYLPESRRSSEINQNNWFEILMKKEVAYGRADPNSDPCGYRSLLCMQLAEKFYQKPGLEKRMKEKDNNYIRPKEMDLLALLDSHVIDYVFIYKSVACQHKLQWLELPNEVNLKNAAISELYLSVSVQLSGKKPGEFVEQKGEAMLYGITMIKTAPNAKAALAFAEFFLSADAGQKLLEENCQPSVIPEQATGYVMIPESLKKYCLEPGE